MKLSKIVLASLVAVSVAACGNLSKQVEKDGTIKSENLVWPNVDKAGFNHDGSQFGSWSNAKNLNTVERGMNKDQIQNLLGRPHFGEGLYGVSEWDYAFNYNMNGKVEHCQVKLVFDENHNLGTVYRKPENCLK